MMLLEHDAKELLAADGVPIPMGVLATTADIELPPALARPWMVKAQIPVGGRGKAGGISRAETAAQLRQSLSELLGTTIKGQTVRACRIEQCVEGMECYFSISLDATHGRLRVLLHSQGGVDIEAHAGHVLAADVAFNGVHPWLGASDVASRAAWRESLKKLAEYHPAAVVAGHKKDVSSPDSPAVLDFMDHYLADFESLKKTSANGQDLAAAMRAKYPDLAVPILIQFSAQAAFRPPSP